MKKPMLDQRGLLDPLIFPLSLTIIIAIGLAVFAIWSYGNYTDVRDNFDEKVQAEVALARDDIREQEQLDFAEREKEPLVQYTAPAALGSIAIKYPKTWSAYVEEDASGSSQLDGYFHPGFVRATDSQLPNAIRVSLENKSYAKELDSFTRAIEDGETKATAVSLSGVKGVRLDGEIGKDVVGSLVLLPLRDKTVRIWTESTEFRKDFDAIILPNFTFVP